MIRKKHSPVIALLLMVMLAFTGKSISQGQEREIIRPTDNGRALINPGMGWTMHYYSNTAIRYGGRLEPSDHLDWFEGCSTVYLRIPWSYMEPEEGQYNWAILDTPAQRWISAGKKVAFRFTTSESWLKYATPKWVQDAGAKMVEYYFKSTHYGPLFDPIYDDPVYLEKLEHFLAAAGKRYDGNPNVAFIDVGTFGTWGEGHTGFSQKLSPEENARMARIHIDLHRKYFPHVQLCISDDVIGPEAPGANFPLMDYCVKNGVSLRDDSILVQKPPRSWFHAELAQKFWKTLPVILEHEHYDSSVRIKAWDDELLLKSVEEYHASYMSIHGYPDSIWNDRSAIIKRINRRLGYRIQIREIDLPKTIQAGEWFEVRTRWANAGVAPCLPGGFMALTLKDDKGGIVSLLVDEHFDVRSLEIGMPDKAPEKQFVSRFRAGLIAPVVKPGIYDVFISVGQRDGTPVLELPLDHSDGHKRYKIGKIQIADPPKGDRK